MTAQTAVLVTLLLVAGCKQARERDPGEIVKRAGQSDVVYVDDDDVDMEAAIARAKASLGDFFKELSAPRPETQYLAKVQFESGASTEFIWLQNLTFDSGLLYGTAGNEGVDVAVKRGERYVAEEKRVVDWIAVSNGKYRGGFTVTLMRDRATPEERARMDEQFDAVPE